MQGKHMAATASLESGKAMPSAELREYMICCGNACLESAPQLQAAQ